MQSNSTRQPPHSLAKVNMYCSSCRATSTFVRLQPSGEWVCIGDAVQRREGCGKRLRPR